VAGVALVEDERLTELEHAVAEKDVDRR